MARDPKARPVRVNNEGTAAEYRYINHPEYGPGAVREIVWSDGTVEQRFVHLRTPEQINQMPKLPPTTGYLIDDSGVDQQWAQVWENNKPTERTPEAQKADELRVADAERKATEATREAAEKQANFDDHKVWETNAEKREREYKERTEARQQSQEARATSAQEASNRQAEARLGLEREKWDVEKSEPKFLSQAGTENPYVVRYNPQSGLMEQIANPNYDKVKVEGERMRQLLATQIQARSVTLDEAKQRYSQWFDSNVKTPLMLAQEARDKAAEQRAALDAEERRRQFAANFGLQKAELGQRAGAAAMSAEQSLLPYRAGPTEAAEMSSAINSLAAGGSMANNASAGINFTPGAFQFDAPDFKKIAKQAASQALSGLSDYRPAEGTYQTADYSGVPQVNTGGAPDIPAGYGAFQDIIDNLNKTYSFGGNAGG